MTAFGVALLGLCWLQLTVRPVDDDPDHAKAILRGQVYLEHLHQIAAQ